MTTAMSATKSCDPQPLPEGDPTPKWTPEQLGQYARDKHQVIARDEKPLASLYWKLGLALTLARKKHKHNQWGSYLKSLEIDKTRASKAQAIYRANHDEKEVATMSVAVAYARRKRKNVKKQKTESSEMSDKSQFREFLKSISLDAERFYDVAAFLQPPEVGEFLMDTEATIKKLEKIRDCLCQHGGK
jgi:hypothetical protein